MYKIFFFLIIKLKYNKYFKIALKLLIKKI